MTEKNHSFRDVVAVTVTEPFVYLYLIFGTSPLFIGFLYYPEQIVTDMWILTGVTLIIALKLSDIGNERIERRVEER